MTSKVNVMKAASKYFHQINSLLSVYSAKNARTGKTCIGENTPNPIRHTSKPTAWIYWYNANIEMDYQICIYELSWANERNDYLAVVWCGVVLWRNVQPLQPKMTMRPRRESQWHTAGSGSGSLSTSGQSVRPGWLRGHSVVSSVSS